jgi:hypothetical protein
MAFPPATLQAFGFTPAGIGAGYVNVKHAPFFAVGDGITNDTAAIQAALDLGGTIFIPAGTYLVRDLTVPQNNTTIFGQGYASCLKRDPAPVGSVRVLNVNKGGAKYRTGVKIYGLRFDGSRGSPNVLYTQENELVNPDNTSDLDVFDCWFENSGQDGLDCDGQNIGLRVRNCRFKNCGGFAIHTYGADNSIIQDVQIEGCGQDWFVGSGPAQPWAIDYNADPATGLVPVNAICRNVFIKDCSQGISMEKMKYGLIEGAVIRNCNAGGLVGVASYGQGIRLGPDGGSNKISNTLIDTTVENGVTIASPLGDCALVNVDVYSPGRYGFEVLVSPRARLANCYVKNPPAHAFEVTNSSDVQLVGCKSEGGPVAGAVLAAFRINNNSQRPSLSACFSSGHLYGLVIAAGTDNWRVIGCTFQGTVTSDVFFSPTAGTNGVFRGNLFGTGSKFENRGTNAVPIGATSVAVAHGLWKAPTMIHVQPIDNLGAATRMWVDHALTTDTHFTVKVDVDPASAAADFLWEANRNA